MLAAHYAMADEGRSEVDQDRTGDVPSASDSSSALQTDARIREQVQQIFAEIEALSDVQIDVSAGIVEVDGEVDSVAEAERALRLATQVDGVIEVRDRLAVNRDLDSRIASTGRTLTEAVRQIVAVLPLLAVAVAIFIVFWLVGAWLGRRQALFRRFSPNVFIAGLLGQAAHLAFIVLGLIVALVLLDATALLGTILGAAGIMGLAIGFAVRDTVENYIASILLSLRNPFSVNDLVDVNGQLGNVVTLTSRATILLSPEGNHIRIPNAAVFKAVIVNYTRRPERRFDFDVGIDAECNLVGAQQIALETLRRVTGVLDDPSAAVIIDALGDSNVVLRCFGWVDQRKSSFGKVRSEAIRQVKEAFDEAGIAMPEPSYRLRMTDDSHADAAGSPDARTAGSGDAPSSQDSLRSSVAPAEVTSVEVDRTIEERVIEDARTDHAGNLLSGKAGKEI